MRTIALVLAAALILLAPAASALGPTGIAADAGVGPDGAIVGGADGRPYYYMLHVTEPEAPREGAEEDDCSHDPERPGREPPPLATATLGLLFAIATWDPLEEPRISGWYPECFAATIAASSVPAWGRVAYDVRTGHYYVEAKTDLVELGPLAVPTSPVGLPVGFTLGFPDAATELILAGGTGIGTEADCEGCPPPNV